MAVSTEISIGSEGRRGRVIWDSGPGGGTWPCAPIAQPIPGSWKIIHDFNSDAARKVGADRQNGTHRDTSQLVGCKARTIVRSVARSASRPETRSLASGGNFEAFEPDIWQFSVPLTGHAAVAFSGRIWHRSAVAGAVAAGVVGCGCSSVVEHDLAKVGVEGSSPFARSIFLHADACISIRLIDGRQRRRSDDCYEGRRTPTVATDVMPPKAYGCVSGTASRSIS